MDTRAVPTCSAGPATGSSPRIRQNLTTRASPPRGENRWNGTRRGERGIALLIALMMTMLLAALGVALVTVTSMDIQIAARFRDGQAARHAAEAGLERAALDLARAPQWDEILRGSVRSGFADSTTTPTLPGGGATLDLRSATARLQQETTRQGFRSTRDPRWRLFAWGSLATLLPPGAIDDRVYLAVWVADDRSDTDEDPLTDGNGVLLLHAESFGHGGTHRVVEATVARPAGALGDGGPRGIRVLAWREIRPEASGAR